MDVFAGAIRDRAQNFNTNQFGIVVSEYPDIVPPLLTSVKLFFSDGVLQINGTEYIDATPGNKIDLKKLFLSNNSYETGFNLVGSTVTAVDDYRINITLPESTSNGVETVRDARWRSPRPNIYMFEWFYI